MNINVAVLLYAATKYDLDGNELDTIYFFKNDEMLNFINNKNEEENFIYRGYVYDPFLPKRINGSWGIAPFENFDEFKKSIKSEYSFLALDLYAEIKKRTS